MTNVSNFNSVDEIREYAFTLKGTELARVARDLDVSGRSTLSANSLRSAITNLLTDVWQGGREPTPATDDELRAMGFDIGVTDDGGTTITPAESDAERRVSVVARVAEGYRAMRAREDATRVVPNRADRRAQRRASNLRNDGSPRGGWVKN